MQHNTPVIGFELIFQHRIDQGFSVLSIINDVGDWVNGRASINLGRPEFPTEEDGLIGEGELIHGGFGFHLVEGGDAGPVIKDDG